MREAHARLDIGKEDFDTVATYLERALRTNGVGTGNVEAIVAAAVDLKEPILDR